jgi:CCR4-NOT transcription complex subunit 1
MNIPGLDDDILRATIDNIKKLVMSEKIRTVTTDRSLLKNLGSWLGKITLARNKPVLHRDIAMKELLLEAFETGRLIACVAFVAKVCAVLCCALLCYAVLCCAMLCFALL